MPSGQAIFCGSQSRYECRLKCGRRDPDIVSELLSRKPSLLRWTPAASKFAGSSQVRKACRRPGHSSSVIDSQAVCPSSNDLEHAA